MNTTTMLHLSLLHPDLRSPSARRLLAKPGSLYATLLDAFEDGDLEHHAGSSPDRAPRGLLYRIDTSRQDGVTTILVQSAARPDWTRLESRRLLAATHSSPPVREIAPDLDTGQEVPFRLRANPTVSTPGREIAPGRRARGRPIPVHGEADQRAWLARRIQCAADLLDLRIIDEGNSRIQPSTGSGAPLVSVLYEGVLRITSPVHFRELLIAGIGRGRAYGFGLLSVPHR